MGLLCCLRHILHNRAKTYCVRQSLRLNITRTSSHYVPDDGLWRSEDELESLKKAQEFLDGLTGEMKEKLDRIEMMFEILKSNHEQVPAFLTSKQKKTMIVDKGGKEEWMEFIYHLGVLEAVKRRKREERKKYEPDIVFGQYMLADSVYPQTQFFRSRMAQTFSSGSGSMPIVIDVGYPMKNTHAGKFLRNLNKTYQLAKDHCNPAHLIVSGLKKNKMLRLAMEQRVEIGRLMVDFREEDYWELFPNMPISYLTTTGREYRGKVDGSTLFVLQSCRYQPTIKRGAKATTLPFNNSIFARSGAMMFDMKAKLLMDLTVEKDVTKVYKDNVYSGEFKHYITDERLRDFQYELKGKYVKPVLRSQYVKAKPGVAPPEIGSLEKKRDEDSCRVRSDYVETE